MSYTFDGLHLFQAGLKCYAYDRDSGFLLKIPKAYLDDCERGDFWCVAYLRGQLAGLPDRGKSTLTSSLAAQSCVVFLTHSCNLSCPYCFDRGSSTIDALEIKKVSAALRRFLLSGTGWKAVHFFGGEPLLEASRLKELVCFCEKTTAQRNDIRLLFSLTTNATLLTESMCRFLNAHRFTVTVSADGYPLENGGFLGSSVKAFPTGQAELLRTLNQWRLRATLLPEQLNIMEELFFRLAGEGPDGICLAPATGPNIRYTMDNAASWAKQLNRIAARLPANGLFLLENIQTITERLSSHGRMPVKDPDSGCELVLDTDGSEYSCHRMLYKDTSTTEKCACADSVDACSTCWAGNLCRRLCPYERRTCDSGTLDALCSMYKAEVELACMLFDAYRGGHRIK